MTAPRASSAVPLSRVLERLRTEDLVVSVPDADPALSGVAADSRLVTTGDLFCAWAGTHYDSHEFVPAAAAAGAAAALVERPVGSSLPQVVVRAGRQAAALAADEVAGRPAREMVLAGVTGTNGKTTTVWILRHLMAARWVTASLGTVGAVMEGGVPLPGSEGLTTPGPVGMATTMRAFRDHGTEAVAMEVSSHALDQARVHALRFSAAIFTNLTRDHLDYHGTLEHYRASKWQLTDLLLPDGVAAINADDPAWDGLEERVPRALRYGLEGGRGTPEVSARGLRMHAGGSDFVMDTPAGSAEVRLPLLGAYNVHNALGAAAACLGLGMELDRIVDGLATAPQIPGRLEQVADRPCRVVTDYAHTPDALERVLSTLKAVSAGRVLVVFGAGGDRDPGKRLLMGQVADRLADVLVVTSDNPRTEDPDRIIDGIMEGVEREDALRVTDRREAIHRALELAAPGDVLLLAGKGHETYQVLGTETVPFDEREIVREWIEERGAAG